MATLNPTIESTTSAPTVSPVLFSPSDRTAGDPTSWRSGRTAFTAGSGTFGATTQPTSSSR